jgi:short subunit dehydrogenase-like uncharacterized protein
MTREHDIVLWGATGFTGSLVARELAAQPDLRWAIAGRDRGKLEALRSELAVDVAVLVGDAGDRASLDAIAEKTRVICSTVGPYAKYGSAMVAACAAAGTHYCDLTGEPHWVREMIDLHHDQAAADGTRIVCSCGFDSIPSDLGVLMMHRAMQERGRRLARVDAYYGEMKGGVSGGTVASMLALLDEARRDPKIRALVRDPYALDPRPRRGGPDRLDLQPIGYDRRLGRWTAPFVMAAINGPVVRRSNALTGYRYGETFRYRERMSTPKGLRGLGFAATVSAGLAGLLIGSQIKPLRRVIERRLPDPGEGPTAAQREAGYYVVRLLAEAAGEPELLLRGEVSDDRDAGYGSTAVMLSAAALCLALDDLDTPGGVLTPAAAMGAVLLERLREAGIKFEVGTGS